MNGRLDLRASHRALETFGRRALDELLPKPLRAEGFETWSPRGDERELELGLAAWQGMALNEYRSQVGFTSLLHAMTQLGLPRDALQTMERLTRDEVVHVELCRRMVRGLGGTDVIPGEPKWVQLWPEVSALEQVIEFVASSLCIGEGLSCALLNAAAKAATDQKARAVLTRMTADESIHGQAGFHFLAILLPLLPAGRKRWLEARAKEAAEQSFSLCLEPYDESPHPFGAVPHADVEPVLITTWDRLIAAGFENLDVTVRFDPRRR